MTLHPVRPAAPADHPAVRELCCELAYGDIPLESFYPDRELFADLLTRYYLEWEPESCRVAVVDGRVVGYLCGCRSSRRQRRVQAARVVPAALARFALRGGLFRGSTWRLLGANLGYWPAGIDFDPDLYPAHLHLGLDAGHRGRDLGRQLVESFLEGLGRAAVRGVHAVVLAENFGAGRFFERLGFRPLGRGAALRRPGQEGGAGKIVYGLRLIE